MKRINRFFIFFLFFNITFSLHSDRYQDGDLIIKGNEIFIIENETFTITGDIWVRDNGKLVIRNATLIINQRYHEEFHMSLHENSSLEISDSKFVVSIPGECFNIHINDNCSIIVQNSDLRSHCLTGLYFSNFNGTANIYKTITSGMSFRIIPNGSGNINIAECEEVKLEFRFDENFIGSFKGLKTGFIESWIFEAGGTIIQIENSTLGLSSLACDGPSEIIVYESELFYFTPCISIPTIKMKAFNSRIYSPTLNVVNRDIRVWDLKPGIYDSWKLSDHTSGEPIQEMIFINSELVEPFNVTLSCSTSEIDGSIMRRLKIDASGNNLKVTNSNILESLMFYYATDSKIHFDNTTLKSLDVFIPGTSVEITGNITFTHDAELINWYSPSVIKRNFPVLVSNKARRISGAELNLYTKDGDLVWSGVTDENGEADFDIVFDDNNYLDTWKLEVNYYGKKFYKNVTLITSTPITIPICNLKISSSAGGSTNPPPGTYTYDKGTEVTISAIPDINYKFSKWTGDVPTEDESDNPIRITIDSDKSIEANFIRQFTLTIASETGGTTHPLPGNYTHDSGTQVTITASPNTGYRFNSWTGNVPSGHENDNPLIITMDSDKSIATNFIRQYTLTIASGAGGTTEPAPGSYIYDAETQVILKAVPSSGYRFSGWNGDASGTTNPITITMDSNKSIKANFIRQYTLTIASGAGGTTDPSPGIYTHDSGTEILLTAKPNKDYELSGWSGDASGNNNPIKVTMNSDKSITANFKQKPFWDKCLIATAAYGSPLHSSVRTLQDFRDRYLMTNKVGLGLVRFYYRNSPPAADFIARHRALKIAVQAVLFPLVAFSYLMLRLRPVITTVIFTLIFALTVFLARFYRRRQRKASPE